PVSRAFERPSSSPCRRSLCRRIIAALDAARQGHTGGFACASAGAQPPFAPAEAGPRLRDIRVLTALKTRVNALVAPGSPLSRYGMQRCRDTNANAAREV